MTMTHESIRVDAGRKPREDELDIFGLTHTGLVRKTNQDHFLICALQRQLAIYATSLPAETRWPRPWWQTVSGARPPVKRPAA
jgi:hypothetical protein